MAAAMRGSKLLSKLRKRPRQATAGDGDLVDRYFLMQAERPGDVEGVEIERLDPFLRGLLFTDGTVTRTLGVQTLAPVTVRRLSQVEVPVPADMAGYLEAEAGEEVSIRRRVSISAGAAVAPALWAESYIVPERLPPGFVGLLDGAPDGIGQSLQRVALESYRELLWLGFDAQPAWAALPSTADRRMIRRLYRIFSDRRASILISESFAVEQRSGTYRLAGLEAGGSGHASTGEPV